jgi:hypothetical protein
MSLVGVRRDKVALSSGIGTTRRTRSSQKLPEQSMEVALLRADTERSDFSFGSQADI